MIWKWQRKPPERGKDEENSIDAEEITMSPENF
jgi:hypothetical protein